MALSTISSSTPVSTRVNIDGAELCALVCAGSAGVHGALVVPHVSESTSMAVAFAAATVALVIAALAQVMVPSPAVSATVATLLLAVATAYLLSRTSGIPGFTEHPEPFDTLGATTSVAEVAASIVAWRQIHQRRHR